MDRSPVTAASYPPDYEHVPTVPELHARRLAVVVASDGKGNPTHYRLKPEGQQIIYDAMNRNAERCRAWDEERRRSWATGTESR